MEDKEYFFDQFPRSLGEEGWIPAFAGMTESDWILKQVQDDIAKNYRA